MKEITLNLRARAMELLAGGRVDLVIGYGTGSLPEFVRPVFVDRPERAEELIFNPLCAQNLTKYILDYRDQPGRVAVVVKGCDSRSINQMMADGQLDREKVFLLGINCPGLADPVLLSVAAGRRDWQVEAEPEGFRLRWPGGERLLPRDEFLMYRCRTCEHHNPVVSDVLLGDPILQGETPDRFAEVRRIESLTPEERAAYWDALFARCLRCYACRNACPACTCRECIFDRPEPEWVARVVAPQSNLAYHLVRAMHVAGRCVDCGECDRVCPVAIPLREINRKILKELAVLFGAPTPGTSHPAPEPLATFAVTDPEVWL